ncbi:MAG: CPBP family intramembrane metalloprotease [Candidatus Nealsonbacteria bacterium]|nr:CPBP family intramembrane metalloprotease [Candidatus Nealsonbacteria bacterium]
MKKEKLSLKKLLFYFVIVEIIAISAATYIDEKMPSDKRPEISFASVILAGPTEEPIFRGIPLIIFGPQAAILGTVLWGILHIQNSIANFAHASIGGIFYYKAWVGQRGKIAVLIHSLFNLALSVYSVLIGESIPILPKGNPIQVGTYLGISVLSSILFFLAWTNTEKPVTNNSLIKSVKAVWLLFIISLSVNFLANQFLLIKNDFISSLLYSLLFGGLMGLSMTKISDNKKNKAKSPVFN